MVDISIRPKVTSTKSYCCASPETQLCGPREPAPNQKMRYGSHFRLGMCNVDKAKLYVFGGGGPVHPVFLRERAAAPMDRQPGLTDSTLAVHGVTRQSRKHFRCAESSRRSIVINGQHLN
mmetsp:Transcript_2178/g.5115  ORF Transcript_2178/g.5115 Transcript_2178/m.5115 type:complete len:120 (-) Transcript_2178:457-816(-)